MLNIGVVWSRRTKNSLVQILWVAQMCSFRKREDTDKGTKYESMTISGASLSPRRCAVCVNIHAWRPEIQVLCYILVFKESNQGAGIV